jgi:hypothetical protein
LPPARWCHPPAIPASSHLTRCPRPLTLRALLLSTRNLWVARDQRQECQTIPRPRQEWEGPSQVFAASFLSLEYLAYIISIDIKNTEVLLIRKKCFWGGGGQRDRIPRAGVSCL